MSRDPEDLGSFFYIKIFQDLWKVTINDEQP